MRKTLITIAATATICIPASTAVAAVTFDNSTPPSSPSWMTRPCLADPAASPLIRNCYWNNTMGYDDPSAGDPNVGFWVRKIPHQRIICYLHSPDDDATPAADQCYVTRIHRDN